MHVKMISSEFHRITIFLMNNEKKNMNLTNSLNRNMAVQESDVQFFYFCTAIPCFVYIFRSSFWRGTQPKTINLNKELILK